MLLAEVEPRPSTHRDSTEFSNREISPMPLERRVRFCGTAGAEVFSEEPRKNLITVSATEYKNESPSSLAASMKPQPCPVPSEYQSSPGRKRRLRLRFGGSKHCP